MTKKKENTATKHTPETKNNGQETVKNKKGKTRKQEKTSTAGTKEEVEKLTNELAEAKDKYLRLYSEFDNYRKRTAKEKLDMMQTAGERIITELLPVLDDFGRAGKSSDAKDEDSIVEGINLIAQKLEKTLQAQGLKEMETPAGTDFDPELHEAITQIPAPESKLKGKIVDTIEKGYYLGDKVIRFAKVVTGS